MKLRSERGQQPLHEDPARAIDAPYRPLGIFDAHAPRRIDENRNHGVADVGVGGAGDRPHQKDDEREKSHEPEGHEDSSSG